MRGEGGGSCRVSGNETAVHRSPNKLWRSNSTYLPYGCRAEKEFGCIPGPVCPLGLLLLRAEGLVAVLDCLSADPRLLLLNRAGALLHQYSLPAHRSTGIKPISLIRSVLVKFSPFSLVFQIRIPDVRKERKKDRLFSKHSVLTINVPIL
jgi:hypothetical protein